MTDQSLAVAHLVPERMLGGDRLEGVCGRVFLPAALTAPIGPLCRLCAATRRGLVGAGRARRRTWRRGGGA